MTKYDRIPDPIRVEPHLTQEDAATVGSACDILRRHMRAADLIASWAMLTEYLALSALKERSEVLRVLFLNSKNRLIRDRIMWRGTIDHVPVYVSDVMRSALILDVSALILCHNHPSGDPTPSDADIKMTKQMVEAARVLGLTIHDHVIVGFGTEANAFSMRGHGTVTF